VLEADPGEEPLHEPVALGHLVQGIDRAPAQQAEVAQAIELQCSDIGIAKLMPAPGELFGGKRTGLVQRLVRRACAHAVSRAQTRLRPSDLARNNSASAARMKSAGAWKPGRYTLVLKNKTMSVELPFTLPAEEQKKEAKGADGKTVPW